MQDQQTRRGFLQAAGIGAAAGVAGAGLSSPAAGADQGRAGGAGRKLSFPLGLASYTLRNFPLDEALKMTQRVGLDHICLKSMHLPLDASPQEIAAAAEQVRKAGITLYAGGVIAMSNEAQTNQAFQYAKAAGLTVIVGVPSAAVLPLVDKKVKEYDIKVAIHNHGPGDKQYPTPESAYEKIKHLDPRIGLCIDVGHTVRAGADPYDSVEKYAGRAHDMHIKDVSAVGPEGKAIEVGRGVIDIPRLLKTLIQVGYSGVVSFEYEKDANDPLAGLAESVGFVRGVLAAI
jgi:sugar phosphate isomerase/epimerase